MKRERPPTKKSNSTLFFFSRQSHRPQSSSTHHLSAFLFSSEKNMDSVPDSVAVANRNNKPHAVCFPFPTQGHLNPFLKLAILLHSRGFHVTFVNKEYNHRRLLKSGGLNYLDGFPGFKYETIPDGLPPPPPEAEDATQDIPSLCDSIAKNCLAPFLALLRRLNALEDGETPPVSCVVCDAGMCLGIDAAREVGVPSFAFRTTSAASYLVNRRCLPALTEKGIIPIKDPTLLTNGYLESKLDWIPSMENLRLRDLPKFIKRTGPNDDFMLNWIMEQAEEASKASALIINTFDDLEASVLADLSSSTCPPIFTVGPLHLLINQLPQSSLKSIGGSLWKEDLQSLEWLDSRAPESVVYVNFGSITFLTPQQLVEFAWGLAASKEDFLWIIRSDAVRGDSGVDLPPELLEETKNRGLIVKWCPQERVLNHHSIGAFLTHCGWNSMLESLAAGVPMICWPFFADQHINCRFACVEWGVGLEIDSNVSRGEVAKIIKEMIGGEKGKEMKSKAMEWKNKAAEATTQKMEADGSSVLNFEKLIKQIHLSTSQVLPSNEGRGG